MAENEILCVAEGHRWKDTRAALLGGMSSSTVADRAADELTRGLSNSLASAHRKGVPLEALLHAAGVSESELRRLIRRFPDRQLARMVAQAIEIHGIQNPLAVGDYAGDLIADSVHDTIMKYAASTEAYLLPGARDELSRALKKRFDTSRVEVRDVVRQSLQGERVARRLAPRGTRASNKVRAAEVADRSLLPAATGNGRAIQKH